MRTPARLLRLAMAGILAGTLAACACSTRPVSSEAPPSSLHDAYYGS